MTATQFWPFFLTAFVPSFIALVGILVNNHHANASSARMDRIESLLQHFIDLHINHEGRIAKVEEKAKDL